MARRTSTLIAALGALAFAIAGLVPTYAAADELKPLYVLATGYQMYSTANVHFDGDVIDPTPGVYVSDSPRCTGLEGGVPIDPSLELGTYTIDGSSCTGMRLLGDNAAEYRIVFVGGSYKVNRVTVNVTATATPIVQALLTGKMIYTVKVRTDYSLKPAPGVPVKIWLLSGQGTPGLQCTAVTGSDGLAQCSAKVLPLVLNPGFRFYYASEATDHYYNEGGSTAAPLV